MVSFCHDNNNGTTSRKKARDYVKWMFDCLAKKISKDGCEDVAVFMVRVVLHILSSYLVQSELPLSHVDYTARSLVRGIDIFAPFIEMVVERYSDSDLFVLLRGKVYSMFLLAETFGAERLMWELARATPGFFVEVCLVFLMCKNFDPVRFYGKRTPLTGQDPNMIFTLLGQSERFLELYKGHVKDFVNKQYLNLSSVTMNLLTGLHTYGVPRVDSAYKSSDIPSAYLRKFKRAIEQARQHLTSARYLGMDEGVIKEIEGLIEKISAARANIKARYKTKTPQDHEEMMVE